MSDEVDWRFTCFLLTKDSNPAKVLGGPSLTLGQSGRHPGSAADSMQGLSERHGLAG